MCNTRFMALILSVFLFISISFAQHERDAVIEIIYPEQETLVDTDFVNVEFYLAPFFDIGDPGCTDCDGYIKAYLNDVFHSNITLDSTAVIDGLTDGNYFLELVVVDPAGTAFIPALGDTVSFSVDTPTQPNFCPPHNFSVNSTADYGNLLLTWTDLSAAGYFEEFFESFDTGLPESWEILDGGTTTDTWFWTQGYGTSNYSIDGTPFMFVDSDDAGSGNTLDEELITPVVPAAGQASLYLIFDQFYNNYVGSETGDVDVWDGSSWVNVARFEDVDYGTWTTPDHQVLDITEYANSDLKIRFHYYNADYDWYWAIDNVTITAVAPERSWAYSYNLTPEGWAAQQMSKEEFHSFYPEGMAADEMIDMSTVERNYVNYRESRSACGDLLRFDIYRDDVLIGNVDTTFYLDSNVTVGTEYCYYLEAVYDDNSTNVFSLPTETICATPELFYAAPATNLGAVGLDESIFVNWTTPDVPNWDFYENFDAGIPVSWTISDANGSGIQWQGEVGAVTGFDSPYAVAYSNDFAVDTDLISPVIDLSAYADGVLYYDYNFQKYASNMDTGKVYISGDNGATWNLEKIYNSDTSIGSEAPTDSITLAAYAGSSQVLIKFHYHDYTGSSWFFAIDNIKLAGSGTSGPRDLTGSTVEADNQYIAGMRHQINFSVSAVALEPSWAFCDSLAITLPAGVTINAAGPEYLGWEDNGFGAPLEAFNGINGQTISWGQDRNDSLGGIYDNLTIWADLTFDDSLSGPLTCSFFFSDDNFDNPLDASGTFEISEHLPAEGELLGYSVFLDGAVEPVTDFLLVDPGFLINDLVNGQSYDIGVNVSYYPNYLSTTETVSASPTWQFGDISGVVTDPNGTPLDSAVVSVAGLTDTTGADGSFLLESLLPETYDINVRRTGFEVSDEQVTVLAQAAPVTIDFTLNPQLSKPINLTGVAGNKQVALSWNSPGFALPGEWAYYHDSSFENAFAATNPGDGLASVFIPGSYPATIQAVRFHVSDAPGFDQDIEVNVYGSDGSTLLSGPNVVTGVSNDWIEVDIQDATIEDGIFLVATVNLAAGGPYISVDAGSYNGSLYFGNSVDGWDEMGQYGPEYQYVGSHEALILSGGRSLSDQGAIDIVSQLPSAGYTSDAILESGHGIDSAPRPGDGLYSIRTESDTLIGYSVYHNLDNGDTLIHNSYTGDTTAVITVPDNYQEYCFNVKAIWETALYDTLESKSSNEACVVPYMAGDLDFNSTADLMDLTIAIDFVLALADPTAEELRGADMNSDGSINIQDLVLMVDAIMGTPTARVSAESSGGSAVLSLINQPGKAIDVKLDYDGSVKALMFTVEKSSGIQLGSVSMKGNNSGLMLFNGASDEYSSSYILLSSGDQPIAVSNETLLSIPYSIIGESENSFEIGLSGSQAADMGGHLIPVVEKSTNMDFDVMPNVYALHQNYPNPFNPVTDIKFDLPDEGFAQLVVYNITGQEVRTLISGNMDAGFHSIRWNGMNNRNEQVATGMYFYQLTAGKYHATKKMVILK